jgi:uncharacterized protein YigE (DUF2233 family)
MRLPRWLATVLGMAIMTPSPSRGEMLDFEGGRFQVHRVDRDNLDNLQLLWKNPSTDQPLQDFNGLRDYLATQGQRIHFATNAGIYERGPKPSGLTVCASKVQVPLNLKDGFGDFYLKPNGVFFIDPDLGASVVTAEEYRSLTVRPRLATQSGPILLRRGRFHPAFKKDSPNLRQRSGVGVRASDGQVIFLMSERHNREKGRVTFHHLARAFLHLGCKDALYLDGDISQMIEDPAEDARFTSNTFAGIFFISLPK